MGGRWLLWPGWRLRFGPNGPPAASARRRGSAGTATAAALRHVTTVEGQLVSHPMADQRRRRSQSPMHARIDPAGPHYRSLRGISATAAVQVTSSNIETS